MESTTYVQRIARNYLQSMAPLPDDVAIAPEHLWGTRPDVLRDGLVALYGLMISLYQGVVNAPKDLGTPLHPDALPRSGSRYTAAAQAVAAIPRLLYSLGLHGEAADIDGDAYLGVNGDDLADHWRRAKVRNAQGLLEASGQFGLIAEPDPGVENALRVSHADAPACALALAAFARAARGVARNDNEPPIAFCRGDMRLMAAAPGRKEPPVTVGDALRSLEGHRSETLRGLDALVTSLGYRAEPRCSSLNRGEWRASYRSPRLGKTLFSFVAEEGELTVRIMFNRTDRILPFIAACPDAVRGSFYASCTCAACGQCESGPHRLVLDGALRRLCGYAWFQHAHVAPDEVAALRMLIETQAQFLAADAQYG